MVRCLKWLDSCLGVYYERWLIWSLQRSINKMIRSIVMKQIMFAIFLLFHCRKGWIAFFVILCFFSGLVFNLIFKFIFYPILTCRKWNGRQQQSPCIQNRYRIVRWVSVLFSNGLRIPHLSVKYNSFVQCIQPYEREPLTTPQWVLQKTGIPYLITTTTSGDNVRFKELVTVLLAKCFDLCVDPSVPTIPRSVFCISYIPLRPLMISRWSSHSRNNRKSNVDSWIISVINSGHAPSVFSLSTPYSHKGSLMESWSHCYKWLEELYPQ